MKKPKISSLVAIALKILFMCACIVLFMIAATIITKHKKQSEPWDEELPEVYGTIELVEVNCPEKILTIEELDKMRAEDCDPALGVGEDVLPELPDDDIRQLAESGRICEVLGHKWNLGCTETHYEHGTKFTETCVICEYSRTRKWIEGHWGEWE